MKPCPKCGSYHLMSQRPIKTDINENDGAKEILKKWVGAHKQGPELEGIAYIVCEDCFHHGPAVDCSKMSYNEAMKSKELYQRVKDLWNSQEEGENPVNPPEKEDEQMKYCIMLLISAVMLCGCEEVRTSQFAKAHQKNWDVVAYDFGKAIYRVKIDGHQYLVFHSDRGTSMIHSESCPCHEKE